jgi:hypothetical protein
MVTLRETEMNEMPKDLVEDMKQLEMEFIEASRRFALKRLEDTDAFILNHMLNVLLSIMAKASCRVVPEEHLDDMIESICLHVKRSFEHYRKREREKHDHS